MEVLDLDLPLSSKTFRVNGLDDDLHRAMLCSCVYK